MSIKLDDPDKAVAQFLYLAATDQNFYDEFVTHAREKVGGAMQKVQNRSQTRCAMVTFDSLTGSITYNNVGTGGGGTGTGGTGGGG